jgi:hypothetical protein
MRRVWQVESSSGEYVDREDSEMVGMEFAGGTMVVEDVADDSDVEDAERVVAGAGAADSLLSSVGDEGAW